MVAMAATAPATTSNTTMTTGTATAIARISPPPPPIIMVTDGVRVTEPICIDVSAPSYTAVDSTAFER